MKLQRDFIEPKDFPAQSAILCRNNAPLLTACLKFLAARIPATILGREIGTQLISLCKKTHAQTISQLATEIPKIINQQIELLSAKSYDTSAAKANLEDKLNCIEALLSAYSPHDSTALLYQDISDMFSNDQSRITLATCHKAKGLEWPHVYILEPHLMPSRWAKAEADKIQERNLEYVAITRSQDSLTYINLDQIQG